MLCTTASPQPVSISRLFSFKARSAFSQCVPQLLDATATAAAQSTAQHRESRGERNKVKSNNSSRACTTAVRAKAVRQVCNGGSTIRRCSTLGPTAAGHDTLLAALPQRYHSCSNTGKTSKHSSVVKVAAEAVFWKRRLKITAQ